jgi:F0F1-type ATP synthase alpha subunit
MELRAEEISQIIKEQITDYDKKVELSETGVVLSVGDGIARIYGLEKAMALELVEFPGGILGLVLNLEEDNVGVAIMGEDTKSKRATSSSAPAALRRFRLARRFLDALLMRRGRTPGRQRPHRSETHTVVLRWWPPALSPVRVCMNPATPV